MQAAHNTPLTSVGPFSLIGDIRLDIGTVQGTPFYRVIGPPNVTTQFDELGVPTMGTISPPSRVSNDPEEKRRSKVPPTATHYSYAYPLPGVNMMPHVFDRNDPRHMFCTVGGFLYFDAMNRIVGKAAIAPGNDLQFDGPFKLPKSVCSALQAQGRLQPVTVPEIKSVGADHFAFLTPGEFKSVSMGAELQMVDSLPVDIPLGGFAYKFSGGNGAEHSCYFRWLPSGSDPIVKPNSPIPEAALLSPRRDLIKIEQLPVSPKLSISPPVSPTLSNIAPSRSAQAAAAASTTPRVTTALVGAATACLPMGMGSHSLPPQHGPLPQATGAPKSFPIGASRSAQASAAGLASSPTPTTPTHAARLPQSTNSATVQPSPQSQPPRQSTSPMPSPCTSMPSRSALAALLSTSPIPTSPTALLATSNVVGGAHLRAQALEATTHTISQSQGVSSTTTPTTTKPPAVGGRSSSTVTHQPTTDIFNTPSRSAQNSIFAATYAKSGGGNEVRAPTRTMSSSPARARASSVQPSQYKVPPLPTLTAPLSTTTTPTTATVTGTHVHNMYGTVTATHSSTAATKIGDMLPNPQQPPPNNRPPEPPALSQMSGHMATSSITKRGDDRDKTGGIHNLPLSGTAPQAVAQSSPPPPASQTALEYATLYEHHKISLHPSNLPPPPSAIPHPTTTPTITTDPHGEFPCNSPTNNNPSNSLIDKWRAVQDRTNVATTSTPHGMTGIDGSNANTFHNNGTDLHRNEAPLTSPRYTSSESLPIPPPPSFATIGESHHVSHSHIYHNTNNTSIASSLATQSTNTTTTTTTATATTSATTITTDSSPHSSSRDSLEVFTPLVDLTPPPKYASILPKDNLNSGGKRAQRGPATPPLMGPGGPGGTASPRQSTASNGLRDRQTTAGFYTVTHNTPQNSKQQRGPEHLSPQTIAPCHTLSGSIGTSSGVTSCSGESTVDNHRHSTSPESTTHTQTSLSSCVLSSGVKFHGGGGGAVHSSPHPHPPNRNRQNSAFKTTVRKNQIVRHNGTILEAPIPIIGGIDLSDPSNATHTHTNMQSHKSFTEQVDNIMDIAGVDEILGLTKVKDSITRMARQALIEQERKKCNVGQGLLAAPMHMALIGNPGTGKTLTARLLGSVFSQLQVIEHPRVTEVFVEDMIGENTAQTEQRTTQIISTAKGGILAIDDAHLLGTPPARTALDILLKVANEESPVIILCSNSSEAMESFLEQTELMKRKMMFQLNFDDYSPTMLVDMFERYVEKQNYKLDDYATGDVLVKLIVQCIKPTDLSMVNGLLVDSWFQRAWMYLNGRLEGAECKSQLVTLSLDDLTMSLCDIASCTFHMQACAV